MLVGINMWAIIRSAKQRALEITLREDREIERLKLEQQKSSGRNKFKL